MRNEVFGEGGDRERGKESKTDGQTESQRERERDKIR